MKPPHTQFAEDALPIEISGFELTGGAVSTVGNADCAANAKATLGEVEAVANRAAHPIVRNPFDEFSTDAALQDEVLDQSAHVVVGESGAHCCFEAETTAQAASDVVLIVAFSDFEFTRGTDSSFARIQTQHDLAKGEEVVLARSGGLDF